MSKLFMAILLALLIAGGAYWYWTGTPQYSMLRISEAVKTHDLEKFRAYFDVESVASHAVDDLGSSSAQDIGGPGLLARLVGRTLGGLLKPELSQVLAKKINNYVAGEPKETPQAENSSSRTEESNSENDKDGVSLAIKTTNDGKTSVDVPGIVSVTTNQQGSSVSIKSNSIKGLVSGFLHKIGDLVKFPSLRELLQEVGLTKENYRGLTAFQTDGKFSHVSLRFQPTDQPELQVELELLESDHRWRVVRFSNLVELSKTVRGI